MHSNALLLFLVAMFPQQEKKTFLEEIGTYGNSKTSFRPINKDWEWGAFFSLYHLQCHLKLVGLFLSIPKHKQVKN